jgi:hypothetical protein
LPNHSCRPCLLDLLLTVGPLRYVLLPACLLTLLESDDRINPSETERLWHCPWRRGGCLRMRRRRFRMSPLNGLTVTPNNLAAHRHFSAPSHGVPEGRGFSRAVGVWTLLRAEQEFYFGRPSPSFRGTGTPACACIFTFVQHYEFESFISSASARDPGSGRFLAQAGVPVLPGSEKMEYEYEGESHDVIDNKGRILLSHDLYDK